MCPIPIGKFTPQSARDKLPLEQHVQAESAHRKIFMISARRQGSPHGASIGDRSPYRTLPDLAIITVRGNPSGTPILSVRLLRCQSFAPMEHTPSADYLLANAESTAVVEFSLGLSGVSYLCSSAVLTCSAKGKLTC